MFNGFGCGSHHNHVLAGQVQLKYWPHACARGRQEGRRVPLVRQRMPQQRHAARRSRRARQAVWRCRAAARVHDEHGQEKEQYEKRRSGERRHYNMELQK